MNGYLWNEKTREIHKPLVDRKTNIINCRLEIDGKINENINSRMTTRNGEFE